MFTLSLLPSLPSAYLEVVVQFLNFSSTESVLMKYVTCNGIAEIPCQSNSHFGGSSKKGGLPIKLNFSTILVEAGEREKNWNDHFHFSAACHSGHWAIPSSSSSSTVILLKIFAMWRRNAYQAIPSSSITSSSSSSIVILHCSQNPCNVSKEKCISNSVTSIKRFLVGM